MSILLVNLCAFASAFCMIGYSLYLIWQQATPEEKKELKEWLKVWKHLKRNHTKK